MNVLVTGSNGFIGKNLLTWLERQPDIRVLEFDQEHTQQDLAERLAAADLVYHLAGVNRPQSVEEFRAGNVDLTAQMCDLLLGAGQATPIVLSSSIQAEQGNPYGVSKHQAEQVLADYSARSGAPVVIFRLSNVFGKWCRPNYNSVVATFCHNIAHDLPITISDPTREVPLVHVDDVVQAFLEVGAEIRDQRAEGRGQRAAPHHSPFTVYRLPFTIPPSLAYYEARPVYTVTLGRLAELIRSFRASRQTLLAPDFGDPFTHKLYGAFLAYLEPNDFAYDLTQRTDPRGSLAEFIKSPGFGQIFVSRTKPGITRGNHFHHTKTEKFLVLEGEAIIRFRHIEDRRSEIRDQRSEVVEYRVSGQDFRVVDIPTGYTHSIENVGQGELVTLFWASEIFDAEQPDTQALAVLE
ncbi:MAG TPA: NAD-dependent epimerase/dehydratase family protein [Anaerolineae bacterium]|nr:NAD-dependent epimerase/dehydratase family protein [Anaerolineae bacterium]